LNNNELNTYTARVACTEPFNKFRVNFAEVLPLKDLFCNRKIEFDYSLDDIELLFTSLKIQEIDNINFASCSRQY